MRLFAPEPARELAERIAAELGEPLAAHEERSFEDGEHKSRPLVSVRGRDVYVVQSLYSDAGQSVNDKLCRLLFFLGALRDAAAARVTAVVPYLCYARKEMKTKPRDPVTTRYVAALFEAVGADRVVALDVHDPAAFQNAFRIRTEHLEARWVFVRHLAERLGGGRVVVVSPDAGGVKRAERLRQALAAELDREVPLAFVEKHRSEGVVSGGTLVGDVADAAAVVVDDLVSSGTTLARAAAACRAGGARTVHAVATHGVFASKASEVLAGSALDEVAVTTSVRPVRLDPALLERTVTVLEVAPLLAEAIRRLHADGSIVDLLERG